MNPILRLVFALCVAAAVVMFVIALAVPERAERPRTWSYGFALAALVMLVLWVYWDVLT